MKPLALTGWSISDFIKSDFADLAVHFPFHFVWGELPSPDELALYLGPRTSGHGPGERWLDFAIVWQQSEGRERKDFGLAEFCRRYETVELWFDTRLDDGLRTTSREKLGARHPLYLKSRLALTEFGKAVVVHEVEFSRHNPIDRWRGGIHLTNGNLWRYDPVLRKP